MLDSSDGIWKRKPLRLHTPVPVFCDLRFVSLHVDPASRPIDNRDFDPEKQIVSCIQQQCT